MRFIRYSCSIFSKKKKLQEKNNFLQRLCHWWCCADNFFQDNYFNDITFIDYIWYIVERNDWYSSKENQVRKIHLNKQTLQSL